MKKIIEKINEYEKRGIENIQMMALVSDTSAEVIFYGLIDGVRYQSNTMVEEGKMDSTIIDAFYEDIVKLVRADEKYDPAKMNIIEADATNCEINYDEKRCRSFRIIKDWEKKLK